MDRLATTITPWELLWTIPALWAWWRYARRAWRALREHRRLVAQHYRETLRLREQIRAEKFLFLMFASECMALFGLITLVWRTPQGPIWNDLSGWIVLLLLIVMQWAIILVGEVTDHHETRLMLLYDREIARLPTEPTR